MKHLVLVATTLVLAGCVSDTTSDKLTTRQACTFALQMAHGAGDVANLAERFGFSKDDAAKLGAAAVAGKDVTTAICTVADTHVLLG